MQSKPIPTSELQIKRAIKQAILIGILLDWEKSNASNDEFRCSTEAPQQEDSDDPFQTALDFAATKTKRSTRRTDETKP